MRISYVVLAVLVPLIVCAPARAGTYDVYSCRLPDGSPAPSSGWTSFGSASDPTGLSSTAYNGCGSGGGLTATMPPYVPVGVDAGWTFTPPAATTIEGFEIFRAVRPAFSSGPVHGYVASLSVWPPAELPNDADEQCLSGVGMSAPPCDKGLGVPALARDQANRYERRALHATRLTLGLGCWTLATFPTRRARRVHYRFPRSHCLCRQDDAARRQPAQVRERRPRVATWHSRSPRRGARGGDGDRSGRGARRDRAGGRRRRGTAALLDDLAASCRRPYVDPMPCPSRGCSRCRSIRARSAMASISSRWLRSTPPEIARCRDPRPCWSRMPSTR